MWTGAPLPPLRVEVTHVAAVLDPMLGPLGFAAGQCGALEGSAQVIFCRGDRDSIDGGCIDLVIDMTLGSDGEWRVSDVRYWGFTSDRWHLAFPAGVGLVEQLTSLASTLPGVLA